MGAGKSFKVSSLADYWWTELTRVLQEGYASRLNAGEEDRTDEGGQGGGMDPMQGLEGLDQAGPKLQ